MKNILYILVAILFLSGCASSNKLLQKGRYDEAIQKSVKKLMKKPADRKEILTLDKAYNIANERDLERIRYLKIENNPKDLNEILNRYQALKNRQSLVRKVTPLNLPDRTISYPYTDYDYEIVAAKSGAADYFYANAQKLMKNNDKESYRQAFYEFKKVQEYIGNYKDVHQQIQLAREKGMSRALVYVKNHTHLRLSPEFEEQLLTVNPRYLDTEWVDYHFRDLDETINYDYYIAVNLRVIDVSPDMVTEKDKIEKKTIEDGFEYVKDARGNVMKDSLGNDIKIPKYKTLTCTLIEKFQQKIVSIEGDIEFTSENPRQMMKREPIGARSVFEHSSARAIGEVEALSEESKKMIERPQLPFPNDIEMILRTTETLKTAIGEGLRRNRNLIR
jgi:hypothetical protein